MSDDHHRLLGSIEHLERGENALLVSSRRVVKGKVRSGRGVAEILEQRR
jgi:hypothetical protein